MTFDPRVAREVVQRQIREQEQQAREQAILDGRAAYTTILTVADEIIRQHGVVLVTKRRQRLYKDDYGREIRDAWETEIGYFREHVLSPALIERCTIETVVLAKLGMVLDPESHFQSVSDHVNTVDEYLDMVLDQYINTVVESLDATVPVPESDPATLSPAGYEEHCAELLRGVGWTVRVCGASGDQGVDLVAERDGVRAVFQCKLHARPVGNGAVQEVYTGRVFHAAHAAAVVSSNGFTPSARVAAEQTNVRLLHHDQLGLFQVERNESNGDAST